jgi:hypothetical protein
VECFFHFNDTSKKTVYLCGLKIPCRERAVTVPKFDEVKSMFVFGEFNKKGNLSVAFGCAIFIMLINNPYQVVA